MKNLTNTPINKNDGQSLTKASAQLVRIKPSKLLLALVTLLHGLIVLSFLSTSLSFAWLQIPIILLSIHLGFYWYQWRLLPCYRVQYLDDRWCLLQKKQDVSSRVLKAKADIRLPIIACYYWSRYVVVLIVESDYTKNRFQYIPVYFDCCSRENFRFIKVMSQSMLAR